MSDKQSPTVEAHQGDAEAKKNNLQKPIAEETFCRLLQLIIEHDAIERSWVKFLIGIAGADVVALWSVASFSDEFSNARLLMWAIAAFGVVSVLCLLLIVYRARQWTHWLMSRAKHYQLKLGIGIYPTGRAPDWHILVRWPECLLDRIFRAAKQSGKQDVETDPQKSQLLPSGGGPNFNLIAWMSLLFVAVVVATPALLGRKSVVAETVTNETEAVFLTNSVHVVTNNLGGLTNVMRVSEVTIISVVR